MTDYARFSELEVIANYAGISYPTDEISRVTHIKHVYKNKLYGGPVYKCIVGVGGLAQLDGIDILTGAAEPTEDIPVITPSIVPPSIVPAGTLINGTAEQQYNTQRQPGEPIYAPGRVPFGWSAVIQGAVPNPVPPGSPNQPFWVRPTTPQSPPPTSSGGFIQSPFERGLQGGGGEVE